MIDYGQRPEPPPSHLAAWIVGTAVLGAGVLVALNLINMWAGWID